MRKLPLFLLFALVFLALSGQAVSGETFAPVDLYISGPPNGQLRIDEPSGSTTESLTIADGETGQGTFQELGQWTTSSFSADSNISGEWIGKAWVSSANRDATITIRYTLLQNDESIEQFEFSGDVNTGESAQLTGSDEFSLHSLDDSPITLQIESSWSGRGPPPPLTEGNTSITFDYGSSSADTRITIPISHLQIMGGGEPTSVPGQNSFFVYVEVYDVFGVDDVLSLDVEDYSMRMGPSSESPWSATVDKVSKKSDYVEVKFLWSYEGHTLPAGENPYSIEVDARDILSDLDWSKNLQTSIYIEPEPDVEINPYSTSKTVEFGKAAVYTLSISNTGSGTDEFIVTFDNDLSWDVLVDITDIELEPGDNQNIKISVTPPNAASDGDESRTEVAVTASSDSEITKSVTLMTTAIKPIPNWDFSIIINKDDSEVYDYGRDSFTIKDRAPIEVSFSVVNQGNDQNNFNIKAISVESAFSTVFDKSIISSLPQGQMDTIILTLTPREDYYGTNTFVEIEVTSSADSNKETETFEVFLEQSGRIIGEDDLQLKVSKGKSLNYGKLEIKNKDVNEVKQIYFGVSGKQPSDKLAEDWFTFSDRDGKNIDYASFLTLLPGKQVEVIITILIPSGADIGSYDMDIWMYNEIGAQISDKYSIQVVAVQAEEGEETDLILYGALVLVLGGVLVYGYRNFYLDDGYEDEYDDFDELEDVPEIFEELEPPAPEPVPAPVAETLPPVPEAVVAPVAEALPPTPTSKPRKKWFGLFGKSGDQVQPVAAEPVVAQPVAAEPVVAQVVTVEPVQEDE